ncbi:MAG: hypothetical protein O3B13_23205 [Planctomycetota bacterium]|nr:hypothetical protein [Planctomycetota bacterium]
MHSSDAEMAKREDLIMLQLKRTRGVAIVVLGGAHDLSNNVPEGVKLIELTVKGYRAASGEKPAATD